jgi:hypothetical protein
MREICVEIANLALDASSRIIFSFSISQIFVFLIFVNLLPLLLRLIQQDKIVRGYMKIYGKQQVTVYNQIHFEINFQIVCDL